MADISSATTIGHISSTTAPSRPAVCTHPRAAIIAHPTCTQAATMRAGLCRPRSACTMIFSRWYTKSDSRNNRLACKVTKISLKIASLWSQVQLIGACYYMHAPQVIHRDLEPGNLFIDANMNVKVCNFALVALLENPGERKKTDLFCVSLLAVLNIFSRRVRTNE